MSVGDPILGLSPGYIERMKALVVVILLALTMPASAEDTDSANLILPQCKGFLVRESSTPPPSEVFRQGVCAGFVAGLGYGVGGRDACPPNGVTRNQAVAVVIKYIEARPERMNEHFW
jgi:hypothetical protein